MVFTFSIFSPCLFSRLSRQPICFVFVCLYILCFYIFSSIFYLKGSQKCPHFFPSKNIEDREKYCFHIFYSSISLLSVEQTSNMLIYRYDNYDPDQYDHLQKTRCSHSSPDIWWEIMFSHYLFSLSLSSQLSRHPICFVFCTYIICTTYCVLL